MPSGWVFDKRLLNDVCSLNMPKSWKLDVFKVKSGDSGEWYWTQVLRSETEGTKPIVLCNCPVGQFQAPLVVIGLEKFICKHGRALLDYIRSKK